MSTNNARQQFQKAVGVLVDEQGTIKERLAIAYTSQLSDIDSHHDLPEEWAIVFDGIRRALTTEEVPGDCGNVSKEVEKLSETEASQIGRQIYDIFLALPG